MAEYPPKQREQNKAQEPRPTRVLYDRCEEPGAAANALPSLWVKCATAQPMMPDQQHRHVREAEPDDRAKEDEVRKCPIHASQRKAHWRGAAASAVAIETRLNRLLPVQCSEKFGAQPLTSAGIPPSQSVMPQ